MEERRIELDEVTVAVLQAGSPGDRPLLLVHGFGGAKEDFADHLDELAQGGRHVVSPDLRGHGSSGHPAGEESYSLEIFAADQLALADALGWGTFDLLGHSMGGMVVQTLVLKSPERVDRLVLMDTCAGPVQGIDIDLIQLAVQVARDEGVGLIADILAEADSPLTTPAGKRLLEERPGYREMGDRNLRACSDDMYAAMAAVMYTQDDRIDRLRAFSGPCLVLVGDQDKPFLEASRHLAEAISDARLVVIPDAGHSPQFENPDAWLEALTSFLDAPTDAPPDAP
jgi:pimeloyl-ACP methyl ester carboxylesterase